MNTIRRIRRRSESGASLVEYSLVIAFIAIACAVALGFLGAQTSGGLSRAGTSIFTTP